MYFSFFGCGYKVLKVVRLVCYTSKEAIKRPLIGGFKSDDVLSGPSNQTLIRYEMTKS